MTQRSQWECLLQNLGNWQGSFSQLSPQAELIEEVKSETILARLNPESSFDSSQDQTIRQTIRQFYPSGIKEKILEYSSLARSVLFFENGAFSQGSTQFSPFGEFGAELGLIDCDRQRRIRLVPIYQSGMLEKFTLIREQLAGTTNPEFPQLSLEMLLGKWQGEAITIYSDFRSPDLLATTLEINQIEQDRIEQKLTFANQQICSTATISANRLLFDSRSDRSSNQSGMQVLFLPDQASAAVPIKINNREPFRLELGWLISANLRQRISRNYDSSGGWISLTLVTEQKM
jgi:Domain of unknown function (DUF3598)